MGAEADDQNSGRPLFGNVALLISAAVVLSVAAAFVVPWIEWSQPGGAKLARYAPLFDGSARLVAEYDAAGNITAWSSQHEVLLPTALALAAEMRPSERQAITKFFSPDGQGQLPMSDLIKRMGDAQVYHSRTRALATDGKTTNSVLLAIRDPRADFLVSFYNPEADAEVSFDPPVPILQADLTPGRTWESTGKRVTSQGGTLDYKYTGRVTEKIRAETETGDALDDCLKVETRFVFSREGEVVYDTISVYTLAPGIGAVDSRTTSAATGELQSRTVALSATDRRIRSASLPTPARPSSPPGDIGAADTGTWEMTRFASTRSATDNSESTIPATWISSDPPLLLAARYGGGLTAFNANEPGESAVWRFQPGGTIFGSPAFDPHANRIYFGAADKRLYALDARGLFLWSFKTGDNIVTRPLIVGSSVIFASEDRFIYCLDGETGREVWRRKKVGAAVVSSPALAEGMAIFGCDDGNVYGFDVATGKLRMQIRVNEPVEAPIVSAEGIILAGTQNGVLHAIDPKIPAEIWSTVVGDKVRTAPVVAAGKVFVVNDNGRLSAYALDTGRRLWSSNETDYNGPPVVAGEQLIVAGQSGDGHAVDFEGRRTRTWPKLNASAASDAGGAFRLGASVGGGAIWFADTKSVIRRLGPPLAGAVPLRPAWFGSFMRPPFTRHLLTVAPVAYGAQMVVLDNEGDIFLLDPTTGTGNRIGALADSAAAVEPTIVGDTMVARSGRALVAVELPGGSTRWKFDAGSGGTLPATVADGTVLWLTQTSTDSTGGKSTEPIGTMHALDLASGAVRWQRQLRGFAGVGMALVRDGVTYTTAPAAAWDLATGEPRWQAQLNGLTIGGGALSESGEVLFIGLIEPTSGDSSIAAIRTVDGSVIWQQPIGPSPLPHSERIGISGNLLVVPTWTGEIVGLDAGTGAEIWRHKPARPRFGAVSVVDGRVWFALNNSRVLALDAQTGRLAAQLSLDIDIAGIAAFSPRPLIHGSHVIVPLGMSLLGLQLPPPLAPAAEPGIQP